MRQTIKFLQSMVEQWETELEEDRTYLAAAERKVVGYREQITKTEERIAEAKAAIELLRKP